MNHKSHRVRLSEDWLSVIIGLALLLLIWLGAIAEVPWPLFGLFS